MIHIWSQKGTSFFRGKNLQRSPSILSERRIETIQLRKVGSGPETVEERSEWDSMGIKTCMDFGIFNMDCRSWIHF